MKGVSRGNKSSVVRLSRRTQEGNADLRAAFEFAVRLQKSGISGRRKPSELLANDDRRCGHRQAARSIRVDRAQVLRIGVKNRLIAYLTSPAKTGKTLSGSLSVAQNGRAASAARPPAGTGTVGKDAPRDSVTSAPCVASGACLPHAIKLRVIINSYATSIMRSPHPPF